MSLYKNGQGRPFMKFNIVNAKNVNMELKKTLR